MLASGWCWATENLSFVLQGLCQVVNQTPWALLGYLGSDVVCFMLVSVVTWAFMSCFVSTHVKLATNYNIVKLVTAQCCLASVQLLYAAAVGNAKREKNVDFTFFRLRNLAWKPISFWDQITLGWFWCHLFCGSILTAVSNGQMHLNLAFFCQDSSLTVSQTYLPRHTLIRGSAICV